MTRQRRKSSVSELVVSSYQLASMRQQAVIESWIAGSLKLGGKLPNSLLVVSIQQVGSLDALLRSMEDELTSDVIQSEIRPWVLNPLTSLSEIWVGQIYEIVRLTQERNLVVDDNILSEIAHDLRVLRIPIEKHEIAQDRILTAPLALSKFSPKQDDIPSRYDKKDPLRAHIMPRAISARGSVQWLAVDISVDVGQRWIERRDLSDRILELLCTARRDVATMCQRGR